MLLSYYIVSYTSDGQGWILLSYPWNDSPNALTGTSGAQWAVAEGVDTIRITILMLLFQEQSCPRCAVNKAGVPGEKFPDYAMF